MVTDDLKIKDMIKYYNVTDILYITLWDRLLVEYRVAGGKQIELGKNLGQGHAGQHGSHKVTEKWNSYRTWMPAVWYMGTTVNINVLYKRAGQHFSSN